MSEDEITALALSLQSAAERLAAHAHRVSDPYEQERLRGKADGIRHARNMLLDYPDGPLRSLYA